MRGYMLVSLSNANKNEFFQLYENQNENEKNIFFNSNIENFIESPPETLGNALADIWLCLAKKYEENQLDFGERETVFTNIHSILPKIEKMDLEKELIHQIFFSKIASFTEVEHNCLLKFFKETIKFDLENRYSCMKKYYFFYAFIKLYNMLNSIDKSYYEKQLQERQIVDEIVNELEDYSKDVTIQTALGQIPTQAREDIFKEYKRTTEISKFFKINKIFEKCSDYAKDSCFNEHAKKIEFLREITNDEINIDSLNLKDNDLDDYIKNKALDYINVNGKLPYKCEEILCGRRSVLERKITHALFNWLGFDKTQQIKKLNLFLSWRGDELEEFNFIFPNLEKLSIKVLSQERLKYLFDKVHLFLNLKTLKLFSEADTLIFFLNKLSKVKFPSIDKQWTGFPENLELVLKFWSGDEDYNESSRKECIKLIGNLPEIGHIIKLTVIKNNSKTQYMHPDPSPVKRIKPLASIALLGLGLNSLMKSAWRQPSSSSLPISMSLGKVGMVAAGIFLTLSIGAAAYYYKTQNIKSQALTSRRLKANQISAKSPLNIVNLDDARV